MSHAWYRIVGWVSLKCFDIKGGSTVQDTPLQQYSCQGWAWNQHFKFIEEPNAKGWFRILARHSNLSLTIKGFSFANNAKVVQGPYWGSAAQLFKLVPTPGFIGTTRIQCATGKCLEVAGNSAGNNAAIQQFTCDAGRTNQRFMIEFVENS